METIKKIALGAIAFLASIPVIDLIHRTVTTIMEHAQIIATEEQEVIQIWRVLGSFPLLGVVLQAALFAYIVFIGPIIEEYIFREVFYPYDPADSFCHSIVRVVTNGFIFGLCHLSPFQGWANLPIFIGTSALGCVFAALREISGDILAPSVAHILNNGTAMFLFLTKV